jgi:endonuclease-3
MKKGSPASQKRMLAKILQGFPVRSWAGSVTPFEALVETILSQNTNDLNRDRAMKRLRSRFDVTPEALAEAPVEQLADCIRPAGLYRVKAPRIKGVSGIILDRFGGDLSSVLERPRTEARSILLDLPGVGYKTADILVAFVAGYPTVPVDTHVMRVSKRLGIARRDAGYEETRLALEALVPDKRRVKMHLSLIRFGREICRAPRPLCPICLVNRTCPSSTVRRKRPRRRRV